MGQLPGGSSRCTGSLLPQLLTYHPQPRRHLVQRPVLEHRQDDALGVSHVQFALGIIVHEMRSGVL